MEQLAEIKERHGDIEVTCTATTDSEKEVPELQGGPFESTAENLVVKEADEKWKHGKRVRIYW